jgi:RNA polymerase sigma-70 factor (ECF subfamily)
VQLDAPDRARAHDSKALERPATSFVTLSRRAGLTATGDVTTVVLMKVPASRYPIETVAQPVSRSAGSRGEQGVVADPRAEFRAIYDGWFDDVSRWIRALGGRDADRDDIVQEVFLVVRRRLKAFDGGNIAGWLYRITTRQVRDFRRRAWVKHIFTRRHSEEPDVLPHGGSSPAAALERKEEQRVLQTLLDKMAEARRTTFVLFEIEGLSGDEIARIQEIPVNTVWTRLHHARREFFALAAKYQRAHAHVQVQAKDAKRRKDREMERTRR